jgi:multidrug efflux pump subunit AcrB/outer membrane protein TolC
VLVVTVLPGGSARDVDETVTQVLEREVNALAGLRHLRATSRDEVSALSAEFAYEKPIGEAVVDVQNAVARVRGQLPAHTREPLLYRITDANRPIVTLALSAGPGSLKTLAELRLLAENDVRDELLAVSGVADVQVFGGRQPEVEVRVDRDALAARGLTLAEVARRLAEHNVSAPAGTVYGSRTEYLVRVAGEFPNPRVLEALPLASTPRGGQVRLGDVARVGLAEADPRSFYHGSGVPAVALNVLRPEGGDTVAAIRSLKARLPALEARYPDVTFALTEDQQPLIDLNVRGMRASLWQAVALTVLVIFFFLADVRAAAVASAAIPLSFLAALGVLWFSPYTLNMVTLSGLIIAVGMVVDASVVVLENIYRHHLEGSGGAEEAAVGGTGEVTLAITAGMLTTVVVLLPVMFTRGFTGRIMTPLNLMITATLVASLAASLTVIPILAARLLGAPRRDPSRIERLAAPVGRAVDRLAGLYVGILRVALRNRGLFLLLALAFLGVTGKVVRPLLGGEEMPPMDTGISVVEFDADSSAPPGEVEAVLGEVEAALLRTPGVLTLSSVVGSESGAVSFGAGGATVQSARITATLVDRTRREETIWEIQEAWRQALRAIPGVRTFRVAEYGATPVSTTKAPFHVILSGPDPVVLDRLADQAHDRLRGVPGLVDLRRSWYPDKVQHDVVVWPELARLYGTSPAEVAEHLRGAVQGVVATGLRLEGFSDLPVRVRYRADQASDPAHLEAAGIPTPLGTVPLRSLARVEARRDQPIITREDLRATVDLTGGNAGLTIAQVTALAQERLEGLPLPAGYELTVAGTARDMAEGQGEMLQALALGLALLFLLLVALFGSFAHPLAIMAAIPLAAAGALWGLLLFDKPFCKPAFMGIILLGGTVVNNAILLLDFIVQARRDGMGKEEAIVASVRLRLRPILMTATSTIVGFFPLIFETAVGLERMSPLGIAAGAGLLVGTVVTTVATPVVYSALDSLGEVLGRVARPRKLAAAALFWGGLGAAVALGATGVRAQERLPEPLTLEAAVAWALTRNPGLEGARAEAERLEAAAQAARAPRAVQVELAGSGTWTQEEHGLIPGAAAGVQRSDHWAFQAGASARYLVWDFGRVDAQARAAAGLAAAGRHSQSRREQEVAFEVSRLFLATLAAGDLAEAAEASRKSLRSLRRTTAALVEQGRVPRVDGLKVDVRLAEVESRLAALEAQKTSLRAALAEALGWSGELPALAEPEPPAELETEPPWAEPAQEGRADLRARKAELGAARDRAEAARKERLPRIEARASYAVYAAPDPSPAAPGGEDSSWADDAAVGLQVALPLFDGGLRRSLAAEARARVRASEAAARGAELAAAREVAAAQAEHRSALARIEANRAAVEAAREALRVERLKYDAGRGAVNDVLAAEAAWWGAESLLRESRRQAEIARRALELALGRDLRR